MPRIINPLDGDDWDLRLQGFPEATFFHRTAWLRVLHETYGFRPFYLVLDSRPQGLLPIVEVNSWITGRRGASLPFTDECAVLAEDPSATGILIHKATQLARSRKWKYWDYRGGTAAWLGATPSVTYYHHTLRLTTDTAGLFARCDGATRRAVRKAESNRLTVEFTQSPVAVHEFYALVGVTRRRQGLPPQPWGFFNNIYRHVIAPGLGSVVLARIDGRAVAGALFLYSGKKVIYKFGASLGSFQELRPNNLVMWRALEHFSRAGYAAVDFGRTSLGNAGLRRFKTGWGAEESKLDYVKWTERGFLRETDRASGWHTRLFRSIPSPLSRLVGALAYRHIA